MPEDTELPRPDDPDLAHDEPNDEPDGDDSILAERYGSS